MKIFKRIFVKLQKIGVLNILPSKVFIKMKYHLFLDSKLNLKNPKTFNEKLQWLKLYNRKKEYTAMVDKYEVKKYVSSLIGEEYVIKTLGIYNKFDEIPFDDLPNRFVIKCTHDSGGLIICKDKTKFNKDEAKIKLQNCLKRNYYWNGREWPYKNVTPRIIIEEYMEDNKTMELRDYKFFCFNGEPKCFKIDFDRFIKHRANYYDINKNILNIGEKDFPPDFNKILDMPINLEQMQDFARKLSKNIPFARIDFYEVNGKIYFGEITFFPSSGTGKFINEYTNELLGNWLVLPNKSKIL